jgi:hypothetical protein
VHNNRTTIPTLITIPCKNFVFENALKRYFFEPYYKNKRKADAARFNA